MILNPFPCSPALAASIAAFNPRRFVWNEISFIPVDICDNDSIKFSVILVTETFLERLFPIAVESTTLFPSLI